LVLIKGISWGNNEGRGGIEADHQKVCTTEGAQGEEKVKDITRMHGDEELEVVEVDNRYMPTFRPSWMKWPNWKVK